MNERLDLNGIIEAAKREDWEAVDAMLPELANQPETLSWVTGQGLRNEDGQLRDLAASILEKADYTLKPVEVSQLKHMVARDENRYAQFRASFALFKRGDRSRLIMTRMRQAVQDPNTKEIAEGYLASK